MHNLAGFSSTDIAIVVIMLVTLIVGFGRGAIKTVISILSWVVAFYLATYFASDYVVYLEPYINNSEVRLWATRVVIFMIVMVIGAIVGNIINHFIVVAQLKSIDRLAGIILGTMFGVFIVASLIILLEFMSLTSNDFFKSSTLIPYFSDVAIWLKSLLPSSLLTPANLPNIIPGQTT